MAISKILLKPYISFKSDISNENQKIPKINSKSDSVEIKNKTKVKPPQISGLRLFFGLLSNDQIDKINESGKLPKNAKFVRDGYGGYSVSFNFMNFRTGTRKLPEGFEVRKSILGFACVLPKDSDGLFVKSKTDKISNAESDDDIDD